MEEGIPITPDEALYSGSDVVKTINRLITKNISNATGKARVPISDIKHKITPEILTEFTKHDWDVDYYSDSPYSDVDNGCLAQPVLYKTS